MPLGIDQASESLATACICVSLETHQASLCAAAYQHDRRIRIYETENDWRLRKDVHARNLRWTVTDTCLSPDQRFLLYSSITPTVHMVSPFLRAFLVFVLLLAARIFPASENVRARKSCPRY